MGPKYLGRRNGDHECACVQVDYDITCNPRTYTGFIIFLQVVCK